MARSQIMARTLINGLRTRVTTRQLIRDFGACLNFDGSNTLVTISNTATLNQSVFSVAAWVKATTFGAATHLSNIFSKEGANSGYTLRAGLGQAQFVVGNGSTNAAATDPVATMRIGTWYHLTGTFDGSTITIYLNAVNKANQALVGYSASSANIMIGENPTFPPRKWSGLIDEPIYCNTALSQTEINNLYFTGKLPASAVSRWKCDEGSGTTVADSITSNPGILTSGTWSTDVFIKPRTLAF